MYAVYGFDSVGFVGWDERLVSRKVFSTVG